jgi:hypothetical protein
MIWGAVLLATIGVKDYKGMMAQRFFLGFFESGVSPVFQFVSPLIGRHASDGPFRSVSDKPLYGFCA